MACSDMGDGCHSCRKRAEWIVEHNGVSIDAAYSIVASDFPRGCGMATRCKNQLSQLAIARAAQQAWDARDRLALAVERASNSGRGGSSFHQVPLFALSLAAAAATLVVVGALAVRSRTRGAGAAFGVVATEEEAASVSDGALLADVAEGGRSFQSDAP